VLDKTKPGLGLDSINGRIETIGGSIQINTSPGKGTEVNIKVPYDEEDKY
jgi:signal transduction histidine kinase